MNSISPLEKLRVRVEALLNRFERNQNESNLLAGVEAIVLPALNDVVSNEFMPFKDRHLVGGGDDGKALVVHYTKVDTVIKMFRDYIETDTFQAYEPGAPMDDVLFPSNNKRIERQKGLDIRVVIGNPPWSRSNNRAYPGIDGRVRDTYSARSSVHNLNPLADPYVKAIRWASDLIQETDNGGIVAFVTNGGFIDSNAFDGFRKAVAEEFDAVYCYNLRCNQRTAGEKSRQEGGKVFGSGSRASVGILMLVKMPTAKPSGEAVRRSRQAKPSGEAVRRSRQAKPSGEAVRRSRQAKPSGEAVRRSRQAKPSGEAVRRSRQAKPSGEAVRRSRQAKPSGEAVRRSRQAKPSGEAVRRSRQAKPSGEAVRRSRQAKPSGEAVRRSRQAKPSGEAVRRSRQAKPSGEAVRRSRQAKPSGEAVRRSRQAKPSGEAVRRSRQAKPSGEAVRRSRQAKPSGEAVRRSRQAKPSGEAVRRSRQAKPSGEAVRRSRQAKPSGEAVRPPISSTKTLETIFRKSESWRFLPKAA